MTVSQMFVVSASCSFWHSWLVYEMCDHSWP